MARDQQGRMMQGIAESRHHAMRTVELIRFPSCQDSVSSAQESE
jgi:hypothetical protein